MHKKAGPKQIILNFQTLGKTMRVTQDMSDINSLFINSGIESITTSYQTV